jgi:hypothetical protein
MPYSSGCCFGNNGTVMLRSNILIIFICNWNKIVTRVVWHDSNLIVSTKSKPRLALVTCWVFKSLWEIHRSRIILGILGYKKILCFFSILDPFPQHVTNGFWCWNPKLIFIVKVILHIPALLSRLYQFCIKINEIVLIWYITH